MFVARSSVFRYASMLLVALMLATAFGPPSAGAEPVPSGPARSWDHPGEVADPFAGRTGTQSVMIELAGAPSGVAYVGAKGRGASEGAAAQEARSQKSRVEQAQQGLLRALAATVPNARMIYRVQAAYNGVAVRADVAAVPQLRGLAGVKAVHLITPHVRDNASSVPFIGAPDAWQGYGATGATIKIGIIDTGIDYVHTNFGGPGASADYDVARSAANNLPGTTLPVENADGRPIFPNAKVVGGWDFAGDAYNGDNAPAPDPNPQDCPVDEGGGHGSHVAGTAAGYGVQADGSTYPGPYDNTVPFDTLRIGPGVAPEAELYALRVFGCNGSTDLTVQAIDWATDPNGDGDLSDRLDVINMSLGSGYGMQDDPSAVASNNAAAAGVIVATSAGNNGDLYYVSGSPGSAARAIAVASSVDPTDVEDGFQVTTPPAAPALKIATFSVNYNWPTLTTPLTADLVYNVSGNTTACSAFPPGSLTDKVVLVDWAPVGTSTFPCGSIARAGNARNAGAVGIIMASGQTFFDTSIPGNADIPAVFTTHTVGSELQAALDTGPTSITFSYAFQGSGKFVSPGAGDTLSTFTSRGPRGDDNGLKPDISAPGQSIFSAAAGTGNRGGSLNGTSMAAPHVAGVMALLKELHPTWSVEELKALAMNTACHDLYTGLGQTGDRYGPARVGAGRVDVPAAVGNAIVAFADGGSGEVSVSFGALEVVGNATLDRTVRVVNKGATPVTYTLGYDERTAIPGVRYTFPDGPSVAVPANDFATFRVRLTADAALMRNSRDNTVASTQGGLPRQWLSEASGLITLTPTGVGTALRVPVYATARPASNMTTEQSQLVFPDPTGTASLSLTGQGVDTGDNYPNDITSLVTGLELAATSGPATLGVGVPESARNADLQYVGVTASRDDPDNPSRIDNSAIYFGIATHGNWSTPATEVEFDIYLDLNEDGADDYLLFSARLTDSDVFVTALVNLSTNATTFQDYINYFTAAELPTAPFNSNVLLLPVHVTGNANGLNFDPLDTRFKYRVVTYSRSADDVVDQTDWLTYDYANLGIDFRSGGVGVPMYTDLPGDTLPATFNQAAYTVNNSQGALLLHHYNATGSRAQVVPVRLAQTITFAQPLAKSYGDPPFIVSATATSGLPVVFGTTTPAACAVGAPTTDTSATVTILAAGACTITADQAGNSTYAAAPQVARTLAVAVALTVTVQGPGALNLGSGSHPVGTPVSLVATPNPGAVFVGWIVDGVNKGWASPLELTMDAPHSVVASFAVAPAFADVPPGHPATAAITELVGRGIVQGYAGDGFGPDDTLQRAQLAAFIARATPGGGSILPPACIVAGSWDCEAWGTPFTDQNGLDAHLWRNVGTLAHYGVAVGYGDGTFGPTDPVTHAQTLSLIARAMVDKGYWLPPPGAGAPAGVPAVHAADVATFLYYAGAVSAPADWSAPATRGWCAQALWAALNSYWGTDGTLPDGRPAGGLVP